MTPSRSGAAGAAGADGAVGAATERGWRTPPVPEETQAPLPRALRLGHGVLVAAGWLLFAWSWHRVTANRPELGELRLLMLGALAVVPVVTLAWVAHNVGIHRRKGPRRSVPAVQMRYETDFNGRRVHADWKALASARRVDIVIEGECKRFVDGGRPSRAVPPAVKELA